MDKVWDGIPQASSWLLVQPQPQLGNGGVAASRQQEMLGDLTLEDFFRQGRRGQRVVGKPGNYAGQRPGPWDNESLHMKRRPGQPGPMLYQVTPANTMYPVMGDGRGFPRGYDGGMVMVPPPTVSQGAATEVSPGSSDGMSALKEADKTNCTGNGAMVENGVRKRCAPEDWSGEKSMELRYRRMIKNRDSAARSCARKQAYTVELEAEMIHLKEENARLRAEEKIILLAKKQLVEKMMEQSKGNANAKKGDRSRRSRSCIW